MKANIRRIVMLCTVVILGSILIFIDVTLIQLLLLLIVAAIVLPFLLGIVTVAEIKTYLADLKKTGFLKRLNDIKIFEKHAPAGAKKEGAKPEKAVKKETSKPSDKKSGFLAHITSTITSLGSLGIILKARSKPGKKVEDINKMLDKTVSEKVSKPTPPVPGVAGGAGSSDSSDPFLSLSGDEFDEGLLDGLDDDPSLASLSDDMSPGSEPASDQPAPELLMPSFDEMDDSAPADSADAGAGLDGLSGLEGGSELDAEFGDLDNLSLDDVELDEDMADSMDTASADDGTPQEMDSSSTPTTPPAAPDPNVVKTAWIPSDAPSGTDNMEDQLGIQSDMASFAGGSGGSDEDLLSSIASDVKTVTKEKDLSLLRELKDFKAPASEIEDELKDMFQKIGGIAKEKEKTLTSSDGNK